MSETPEEIEARAYRNAYQKAYRDFTERDGKIIKAFPCSICRAADARDERHRQGCPTLKPVPKAELLQLARIVEAGWAADNAKRAEKAKKRATT